MTDRAVRNLELLRGSASTARVLNLLRVWEENGDSAFDSAVRNPIGPRARSSARRL